MKIIWKWTLVREKSSNNFSARNKTTSRTSIDSPSSRSRNSSLGVQVSNSIRSALDLALAAHKAKQHAMINEHERSKSTEKLSDYVGFDVCAISMHKDSILA